MRKYRILAILAAAAFSTAGAFAGSHGCGSMAACKAECDLALAGLNLTEEQKMKLAEIQKDCDKQGCTDSNREKFLEGAKAILSAEQFAQLREACRIVSRQEKPQT